MHAVRPAAALTLAAALVFAACGDVTVPADPASCRAPSQCGEGLTCVLEHCVAIGANRSVLAARIVPAPTSSLLQQHVPAIELQKGEQVLVTLVDPVILTGVIRHADNPLASNVAGELEARAQGDIPGFDYRFTTRSLDGLDAAGLGYTLALLPGRTYELTFRPDLKSTPAHRFTLDADDVITGRRDIALPAIGEYASFDAFVRLATPTPTPVRGARVSFQLPDGGALSPTSTDDINGWFSVLLPPGTDRVKVAVEAPDDGPVFPDFVSEWITPSTAAADNILIPPLPAGLEPFEAQLLVVAPDESTDHLQPVAGLAITAVGDLQGGTLRRAAVTDAEGIARFTALPGAWEILVNVPPGPTYAAQVARLNVLYGEGAASDPIEIPLDPRPWLTGRVVDHSGAPLDGGSVVATRRNTKPPGVTLAPAPAPFTGPVGPDGGFALRVDAGVYDLRITPSPGSGAPAALVPGITVEAGVDVPVPLPRPALARVTVADPAGAFRSDVTVELYELPTEDAAAPAMAARPPLLVKGTTGTDGFVDLLVPFVP